MIKYAVGVIGWTYLVSIYVYLLIHYPTPEWYEVLTAIWILVGLIIALMYIIKY